jgi:hypothetical protein
MRAILSALVLALLAGPAWARVSVKKVTWSNDCDLIVQYKGDHVSYSAIRGALLYGQSTDLYATTEGDRITVRSVNDHVLVLTFVQKGIDGAQFVVAVKENKNKDFMPVNTMAIWVHGPNAEAEFKYELEQMTRLYGNDEERALMVLGGFFSGEKAKREWLEFVNLLNDGKLNPLSAQAETVWQDKPEKRAAVKLSDSGGDAAQAQAAAREKKKKKKKHKSSGPRYEEVRGPYFNFFY